MSIVSIVITTTITTHACVCARTPRDAHTHANQGLRVTLLKRSTSEGLFMIKIAKASLCGTDPKYLVDGESDPIVVRVTTESERRVMAEITSSSPGDPKEGFDPNVWEIGVMTVANLIAKHFPDNHNILIRESEDDEFC